MNNVKTMKYMEILKMMINTHLITNNTKTLTDEEYRSLAEKAWNVVDDKLVNR